MTSASEVALDPTTASKAGYRTRTIEVTAVAGEHVPAKLALERLPPPVAARPTTIVVMTPAPAPKSKPSHAWIWITTGAVGAVALGLGLGLGLGLHNGPPSSTLGTYPAGLP